MNFTLTKTEQDILELLWKTKHWISGAEFWDYFNRHGKTCKRQTINTYLARMSEKGLLVKNGTKYMYAYTKEEFDQKKAEEILDSMYNGLVKNFIIALGGSKKLSLSEAAELKDYLEQLETDEHDGL